MLAYLGSSWAVPEELPLPPMCSLPTEILRHLVLPALFRADVAVCADLTRGLLQSIREIPPGRVPYDL